MLHSLGECSSFPSDHTGRLNAWILLTWGRGDLKLLKNLDQKLIQDLGFRHLLGHSNSFFCLITTWKSEQVINCHRSQSSKADVQIRKAKCIQTQNSGMFSFRVCIIILRTRMSAVASQSRLSTVLHVNRSSASVRRTLPQSAALTLGI